MKLKAVKVYESFAEATAAIFMHPAGAVQVLPFHGKWIILTNKQAEELYYEPAGQKRSN